ncbi:MAG: tetratricopeptide repeat protein [Micavibrio sp.]|nr:tetratricopeptide repeat protein [Micavibrio sp.]
MKNSSSSVSVKVKILSTIGLFAIFAVSLGIYHFQFSASAQYKEGLAYLNGSGVNRNKDEGMRLLTSAAERGNADAQFQLGVIYYRAGRSQEGARWYKKSSENGNAEAKNIVTSLVRQGFKFQSEEAIACGQAPIDCIKRNPDSLKRYISRELVDGFTQVQDKFLETQEGKKFPKVRLVNIGDSYPAFAKLMIDAGYSCESFRFINRDFDQLSSNEQANFLSGFYKFLQSEKNPYSTLIRDKCQSTDESQDVISISLTKMGTVYQVSQKFHYKAGYSDQLLSDVGLSDDERQKNDEKNRYSGATGIKWDRDGYKGDLSLNDNCRTCGGETEYRIQLIAPDYKNEADEFFSNNQVALFSSQQEKSADSGEKIFDGTQCRLKPVECIQGDPDALMRYFNKDFDPDFAQQQALFQKHSSQEKTPVIRGLKIGDSYQEFASKLIKLGYLCDSFKSLARDFDDPDMWQASSIPSSDSPQTARQSFYKRFYVHDGKATSLKSDECRPSTSSMSETRLLVNFTKMGTIDKIRWHFYADKGLFNEMLIESGFSDEQLDKLKDKMRYSGYSHTEWKQASYDWSFSVQDGCLHCEGATAYNIEVEGREYKASADSYFAEKYKSGQVVNYSSARFPDSAAQSDDSAALETASNWNGVWVADVEKTIQEDPKGFDADNKDLIAGMEKIKLTIMGSNVEFQDPFYPSLFCERQDLGEQPIFSFNMCYAENGKYVEVAYGIHNKGGEVYYEISNDASFDKWQKLGDPNKPTDYKAPKRLVYFKKLSETGDVRPSKAVTKARTDDKKHMNDDDDGE